MRARIWLALSITALLGLTVGAATAVAAQPRLWTVGQNCGDGEKIFKGECGDAGETVIPRGIAADPDSGHLFVADQRNRRIDEFTAWGAFVKAWGWGVRDGSAELQGCGPGAIPPNATCETGLIGSGPGQLSAPQGITIDSSGDLYVVDRDDHRVQKFDQEGHFLLMFGGGVNKGPLHPGDLCTAQHLAEGDSCGAGATGTEPGQFSAEWPVSSYIAVGPGDQVYVGDEGRIQQFSSAGAFQKVIDLPEDKSVGALAADPKLGDLVFSYFNPPGLTYSEANHNAFRVNPATGTIVDTVEIAIPRALAVSADGSLYAFDEGALDFGSGTDLSANHITRLLKFNSSGDLVEVVAANSEEGPQGEDEFGTSTGLAANTVTAAGAVDIYLSNSVNEKAFIRAYGPPPDKWAPPAAPPSVDGQYAISVGANDAVLGAEINPHFWPDTTYRVEYGTGKCSEGGCASQPAAPGSSLGGQIVDVDVRTPGVFLTGLAPGTTYHYRFVAQSSGGDPTVGAEETFHTFALPIAVIDCPNQPLRTGPSAALPDCRGYEMVSPVDKEGGDIVPGGGELGTTEGQSASSGDAFAYFSYRPFGGAASAPFASQYLARRDAGTGWSTEPISPPQEGAPLPEAEGAQLDRTFKAFSPDLETAWNQTLTEPVLAPGGLAGYPNIYRRDNIAGTYQACTTAAPFPGEPKSYPDLMGVAADGDHAVFRIDDKLTADAVNSVDAGGRQLYECSFSDEGTATVRLISRLPDGSPSAGGVGSTLGASTGAHDDEFNKPFYHSWTEDALSADGSRVFWTRIPGGSGGSGAGPLYVRVNATEEQSKLSGAGLCTQALKACTYALSTDPARYWDATADGSDALYVVEAGPQAGDLYLYDVGMAISGQPPRTLIAKGTISVLATSDDLSRVYFLSKEAIGGEGIKGQPNLYLYEAGEPSTPHLVATLSGHDASGFDLPSAANKSSVRHLAHATADGSSLVFSSDSTPLAASVAGYDNTDLATGQPDAEIYRYEAASGELACVSCNPSGSRAAGGRQVGLINNGTRAYAISRLAGRASTFYEGNVLSQDGSRLYFESYQPLALADTNGKTDVYQWEQAGSGSCQAGDFDYVPHSGGCLSLISSGKSTQDVKLHDASQNGSDVFFTTAQSLVGQDPGSVDLYDARAGGGFPPPAAPQAPCEGEACQGLVSPPDDPTPASAGTEGHGNALPARKPCAKGKVRRKGRCVKPKRSKQHHQRQSHHRRQAR